MNNRYNLYNLEALFKKYLLAGNRRPRTVFRSGSGFLTKSNALSPITIKNYLSDLRHFLGWLTFYLRSHPEKAKTVRKIPETSKTKDIRNLEVDLTAITPNLIQNYKSYLSQNNVPIKTANRRLSTLRKFCSFCISQGWMKENPAKKILNQKISLTLQKSQRNKQTLNKFSRDLYQSGLSKTTIKNYLSDVQEFLNVISSNN